MSSEISRIDLCTGMFLSWRKVTFPRSGSTSDASPPVCAACAKADGAIREIRTAAREPRRTRRRSDLIIAALFKPNLERCKDNHPVLRAIAYLRCGRRPQLARGLFQADGGVVSPGPGWGRASRPWP